MEIPKSSDMKLHRYPFLFILIFLTSVLLSGCYFFPKEEEVLAPPLTKPEKITYETTVVKKGSIEKKIQCTGYFESTDNINLYFEDSNGRLKGIYVNNGQIVKKGDLIAELETDSIEENIKFQEIEYEKLQLQCNRIKTRMDMEDGADEYDYTLAALDLESCRLKLDILKNQLEKTKIYSPLSGTAVYTASLKPGDFIDSYQTLATIADMTQLQLQYTGVSVPNFEFGMTPYIALPNDKTEYTGHVVITPKNVSSDANDQLKNSVMIKVDNIPASVRVGTSALITLILDKRENVIVIPRQLVNNFGGRNFVYVLHGDNREERDVELGLDTGIEVEIVKGLDEGEQIIIN